MNKFSQMHKFFMVIMFLGSGYALVMPGSGECATLPKKLKGLKTSLHSLQDKLTELKDKLEELKLKLGNGSEDQLIDAARAAIGAAKKSLSADEKGRAIELALKAMDFLSMIDEESEKFEVVGYAKEDACDVIFKNENMPAYEKALEWAAHALQSPKGSFVDSAEKIFQVSFIQPSSGVIARGEKYPEGGPSNENLYAFEKAFEAAGKAITSSNKWVRMGGRNLFLTLIKGKELNYRPYAPAFGQAIHAGLQALNSSDEQIRSFAISYLDRVITEQHQIIKIQPKLNIDQNTLQQIEEMCKDPSNALFKGRLENLLARLKTLA